MTRPALVAVGAIGAALAGGLLEAGPAAIALAMAAAVLVTAAALAARPQGAVRRRDAVRLAAVWVGATLVIGRIAVGTLVWPAQGAAADVAGRTAWSGRVVSVSAPRDGRQRFVLEVDGASARLEVRAPRYPEVGAGARVTVTGDALPPRDDPYGRSLAARGIVASLLTRSIRLDPPDGGVGAVFGWLRGLGDGALRAAVPEPAGGLAAGILLGLRERVDRAVAADFATTGLSHVVAISGWNIAIVVVALGILLRRLARRPRTLVTLVTVCAYVGVVGATPPVVRAALMAGIVLVARESGRRAAAAAALAWAVVAMLVADPASIDDPGFRLSAAATAGLLVWATPLTERIASVGGGRLPGWIAETLGVSLAAQAATLPLVLIGFGRLSLVSPAANLVVAPLVAPAMGAGVVALLGGSAAAVGLPPVIVALAGVPAWVGFGSIVLAATTAARLPFASVTVSPPWDAALAMIAGGALLLVGSARGRTALALLWGRGRWAWRIRRAADGAPGTLGLEAASSAGLPGVGGGRRGPGRRPAGAERPGRRPRRRWTRYLAAAFAIVLVGVTIGAARLPDGRARVVVLDIGQGDAILVEDGHGGRLLVDGGPDPDRLVAALDARVPPWDRRIDVVAVTHPHEDHDGGLPGLIGRYAVGRVIEPGMAGTGPGYRAWRSALAAHGIPVGTVATGDTLRVGAVLLRVLWPDGAAVPREPSSEGRVVNDSSIVLLGECDGVLFLLAGDAEEDVDPALVARGLPHVALYKVAHHGSRTASSDALLAALAPRVAIVSVGDDNTYGHPSPVTLARLVAHGARVFRTDRDGTVTATIADGRLEVRADREGAGTAAALLYHRTDDSPRPRRGRRAPALPRSATVAPPPRPGRGGDLRMARAARRVIRQARRPATHRGGSAPPRCRQARRPGRCRRARPTRGPLGSVARRARVRGARPDRGMAPGHAPGGRRRVRGVALRGRRRGAHRGLRRQAGRPAAGDDGRAVRLVGAALPPA